MAEINYQALVWLTYRLTASFAMGIPLAIFIWALIRKEAAIIRLLSIYWKNASLMAISMLLFAGQSSIGFLSSFVSPFLMVGSVWFWTDLNEEIADFPPKRPLPLTLKIWRWSLSFWGICYTSIAFNSIKCTQLNVGLACKSWLEAPVNLNKSLKTIFNFLFGANWSESLSAFIGYIGLIAFVIIFIQWLFTHLPKQGRIAGDF